MAVQGGTKERTWHFVDSVGLLIIPEPSVESRVPVKVTTAVPLLPLIFTIEEVEVNPVQSISMWYFNQIRIKGKQRQ